MLLNEPLVIVPNEIRAQTLALKFSCNLNVIISGYIPIACYANLKCAGAATEVMVLSRALTKMRETSAGVRGDA